MGDPDYGPQATSAAGTDPRGRVRGWRSGSRALRRTAVDADAAADGNVAGGTADLDDLRWLRLPGTAREVRMVSDLFATRAPASRVDIFTRADASESNLRGLHEQGVLQDYRYLLFAAHGYLADEPAVNSVVLARPSVRDPSAHGSFRHDGYVSAAEWPSLDLRSDLVVVSACDSGAGSSLPGEGVLGLAYALAAAGNVHALLTLWPVHDDATAAFVTEFFRHVLDGDPPAVALASTKRLFMNHARYSRPWYWAGFVLYGP
jgi:CHAT domain-containing protein